MNQRVQKGDGVVFVSAVGSNTNIHIVSLHVQILCKRSQSVYRQTEKAHLTCRVSLVIQHGDVSGIQIDVFGLELSTDNIGFKVNKHSLTGQIFEVIAAKKENISLVRVDIHHQLHVAIIVIRT